VSTDSQEDRILELLESRQGWVPAPELARISLQYCRAIASLRPVGHAIENRVERHGRSRHGFYRLRRSAPITVQPQAKATVPSNSLFPERHVDNG
jgi:hypothetical protein